MVRHSGYIFMLTHNANSTHIFDNVKDLNNFVDSIVKSKYGSTLIFEGQNNMGVLVNVYSYSDGSQDVFVVRMKSREVEDE